MHLKIRAALAQGFLLLSLTASVTVATAAAQVSWKLTHKARPGVVHTSAAAVDLRRQRVLSLESLGSTQLQISEFRGKAWRVVHTGPLLFYPRDAAYDPRRDRLVAIGERPTGAVEIWEWDGRTWLRPTARLPRRGSRFNELTYDPRRGVVVLLLHDLLSMQVFDWNGSAWRERSAVNAPAARSGAACAFDPRSGMMLMFGGQDMLGSVLDDTWVLQGKIWTRLSGRAPTRRLSAGMCYDTTRDRFVLFGGKDRSGISYRSKSDTWEWDGRWQLRHDFQSQWEMRHGHSMLQVGERIFRFGGLATAGGRLSLTHDAVYDYGPNVPGRTSSFGQACGGSSAPRVSLLGRPWIGATWQFGVTGAASRAPKVLFTGSSKRSWGTIQLPLNLRSVGMPGCSLVASPDVVLPMQGSTVRYGIPPLRALVGATYYHQIAVVDTQANTAGLAWSDGLEVRIGER